MNALERLRETTCLKVFLTATLLPSHETVLAEACGFPMSRTHVIRTPIARTNHKLQMAPVAPHRIVDVGLRLATLLLRKWETDETIRGIIFVRSLNKLRVAAESATFPVCTFYGKMTDQEKSSQLHSWLSGEHSAKWMISTTALIHGVDHPRVDAVIFLESPYGLYDLVQGAGRSGRAGQEALVTVIYAGLPQALPTESPHCCRMEMGEVLNTTACRRLPISKAMDGKGLSCLQLPNSLLCDLCDGRLDPLINHAITSAPSTCVQTTTPALEPVLQPPPQSSPEALITGYAAHASATARKKHGESVKDLMTRYAGCFVCRIQHDDHSPCHDVCGNSGASGCMVDKHRAYGCTAYTYKIGWMDWKKTFAWPKDVSRCYFCGFPNSVLPSAHRNDDSRYPGKCQFSDTAVVTAWHILHSPELLEGLKAELGFVPQANERADFATWLVQYGSESEEIRLLSVFSWLCGRYYPTEPRSG